MSMGDAVELHDYWGEHPPTHLILHAVHRKEPAAGGSRQSDFRETLREQPSESETMQQFFEMQQIAGSVLGQPREMPQHLKDLADYAEEMISKMRPN